MPPVAAQGGVAGVTNKALLLACVNSTVVDAAIKENVSYDALNGVIDRNIQPAIDWKEINCLVLLCYICTSHLL
jgi:hypothetical protein